MAERIFLLVAGNLFHYCGSTWSYVALLETRSNNLYVRLKIMVYLCFLAMVLVHDFIHYKSPLRKCNEEKTELLLRRKLLALYHVFRDRLVLNKSLNECNHSTFRKLLQRKKVKNSKEVAAAVAVVACRNSGSCSITTSTNKETQQCQYSLKCTSYLS